MTDVRMALAQLLENGSGADLLRELVGYMAQNLMICGTFSRAHHANSPRSD